MATQYCEKCGRPLEDFGSFCIHKNLLTSDEAARFLGISKSYLYKLTMQRRIPHYKPCGKLNYFDRSELEEWAKSVKVPTMNEIEATAQAYCRTKKGAL